MREKFLGDSYDAVKRMWRQLLDGTSTLYAHPRFIEAHLRDQFQRLTGIETISGKLPDHCSILNDPDTGIRLPFAKNQSESRAHISLATILSQLTSCHPYCIITFDQSQYRHSGISLKNQRAEKMRHLSEHGAFSFYYASHAPFLFTFPTSENRQRTLNILVAEGIPVERLEAH